MGTIDALVVDADPQELQATLALLAVKEKIRIADTARSGYEAVAKAYTCHPQVVLTEMTMETKAAGLLALKEINSTLKNCRVIFYSFVRAPELICQAYAAGAVNYLFKPSAPSALQRAVIAAGMGKPIISGDTGGILLEDYQRLKRRQENLGSLIRISMELTASERAILRLLAEGMQPSEIESVRFIEHSTMKTHISHILKKFDVGGLAQVVELLTTSDFFSLIGEDI